MSSPLDPRARAALEALSERLADEGLVMRVYVHGGIVMAFALDPDKPLIDFTEAADKGDEVLATVGADIAREHGLPADWISWLNRRPGPTPAPTPSRRRERLKAILGFLRGLTRRRQ